MTSWIFLWSVERCKTEHGAFCILFISFCQAPLRRCGLLVASPGLRFEEALFMVSGLDSKSAEVEIQLENIVGKSLEQTTQRKSVKR